MVIVSRPVHHASPSVASAGHAKEQLPHTEATLTANSKGKQAFLGRRF